MIETTTLAALASETDEDLLVRYQQLDDEAAYKELDSRHRKQLLAHVLRWQGGVLRADAEDIVQEALLEFYENRKRYAPKSVRALLHKIVGDRCKKHVEHAEVKKRDHRRTIHPDGYCGIVTHNYEKRNSGCAALLPDPKTDPAITDTRIEVDEMLGAIVPEEADAIRLTKIEGHSAESAAKLRDIPARTMRHRVERGMDTLKKLTAPLLILLAVLSAAISACNLDMGMNHCATEADADRILRRNERHESNRLCRKSMELPIRPGAAEVDASMTRVVNARHEDYDVLIARPSKWGNPFQIGRDGDRQRVIQMYEVHVRRQPDLLAALPELVGKRLGCYCKPEACHGDVLVKLLRELFLEV